MRAFRARSGPFDEQLRFSTDEIDTMCIDALKKIGLLPESPEAIRIERFIEKYFNCRVVYDDLEAGAMGCTAFRENGSVEAVFVSKRIDDGFPSSDRRVRSTLAHEGGHGLMHAVLFMGVANQTHFALDGDRRENLDLKGRRILCPEEDIRPATKKGRYDGRWWEWQANRAIGGFLLPKILVRQACAGFTECSEITKSPWLPDGARKAAEREVATVFDVNPVVARIRLGEMFPAQAAQMQF